MDKNEQVDYISNDEVQSITKKNLNKRIAEKTNDLIRYNKRKKVSFIFSMMYLLMGFIFMYFAFTKKYIPITGTIVYVSSIVFLFLGLLQTSILFYGHNSITSMDLEIHFLEDELELFEAKSQDVEMKADKQFRLNQRELKRYYDLNLLQTKTLSKFGILLMLCGVTIIACTIYFYFFLKDSSKLVLVMGSISGILVNFLGAMFINTYTKTFEAAIQFHSKLANSNNLLLANSIASKITSEELRNNTLSEVAKNISMSKEIN